MYGNSKEEKPFYQKKRFILPVLVLFVLLVSVVRTTAWLRNIRSLQTVTAIQIGNLDLNGPVDDTIAIDLGSINTTDDGSELYGFKVDIKNANYYRVQLGYTTNLDLTYTIYPASLEPSSNPKVEFGDKKTPLYYNPDNRLGGDFLAPDTANNESEKGKRHHDTYGDYTRVQTNAEPTYWQSEPIHAGQHDSHYYILKINWEQPKDDKETDMIYLTVGIDNKLTNNESGGGAS